MFITGIILGLITLRNVWNLSESFFPVRLPYLISIWFFYSLEWISLLYAI